MPSRRFILGSIAVLSISLVTPAAAQTETVLYSFTNTPDGSVPQGGTIFDATGNLYGTTVGGGSDATDCEGGCGTVFELSPGINGTWTEKTLHSFVLNGVDGVVPRASLTFDAAGNLYGTAANGGTSGVGDVFELSPGTNGTWNEAVLLNFNYSNGSNPWGTLAFDTAGNLYGTARGGGSYNGGTVFELSPGTNGTWTEKTLHNFGLLPDGADVRGMVRGPDGVLYGVTGFGGPHNMGTVFSLSPGAKGTWKEKVLLSFNGKNGYEPDFGNLLLDAAGNLYGTTEEGGPSNQGVVFQLVPALAWLGRTNSTWKEKILFGQDGGGNLVLDKAGNLYGTVYSWGLGWGSIIQLTPGPKDTWTETLLYAFEGSPGAANPIGALVWDSSGNIYGTTSCGGSDVSGTGVGCGGVGYGTVYELTR